MSDTTHKDITHPDGSWSRHEYRYESELWLPPKKNEPTLSAQDDEIKTPDRLFEQAKSWPRELLENTVYADFQAFPDTREQVAVWDSKEHAIDLDGRIIITSKAVFLLVINQTYAGVMVYRKAMSSRLKK